VKPSVQIPVPKKKKGQGEGQETHKNILSSVLYFSVYLSAAPKVDLRQLSKIKSN
jgi:hypothetical protein